MITEKMKERVYHAMPDTPISVDVLAWQVKIQRNRLGYILRLLKFDGRVEYLGRHYNFTAKCMKTEWKRK